jgi:hypothetical protein
MKTYTQFKQDHPIGSSVAKPFAPFDFRGECVSYGLTKSVEVDGVPFNAPMGHAAQIPFNPTFLKYYEQVASPIEGDLMFWEDDAGNWTGPEGHMAVYDGGGYMMNQNYGGSRVISQNKVFTPGFIGYFRLKGGQSMQVTEPLFRRLWSLVGLDIGPEARQPTQKEVDEAVGRDVLEFLDYWMNTEPLKEQRAQAALFKSSMAGLRAQLAAATKPVEAGEDSKKLQAIKDALGIK